MATMYIITGPAGIGKSTISEKIADTLPKCALIEGDTIYSFIKGGYVSPWKDGNHLEIFWKNCFSIIDNYLNDGYDVVFNYIVNIEKFDIIKEKYKDHNVKFVMLVADLSVLITRDMQRPIECQMGERCSILLNNFLNSGFDAKYILDTTKLSITDTVNHIINDDELFI